ncbi:MAG: DegV family protein [Lachnospiraceae bacterium]|nr:DegV family protein [Lachnospiraceae bacterium]MBQ6089929.1 DegV family protein [Lachnospiraceae bacterium]MBR5368382.1 DegV family protein [Lachnospiraceae bacterium]
MRDYIISTDSTADLPDDYVKQHNITVHPLYYVLDDFQYGGERMIPKHEFYQRMRDGAVATTCASNPDVVSSLFTREVEAGYDILHIGFSSALSSSYNNAAVVSREVMEAHPEAKITVIDSLAASLGQGLLVHYAVKLKEEGKSLEEVAEWVENNKLHICHQFTVEDLKYLYRGGRISKSVAILGTLINVKPVLHVDNEGRLVPMSNVRGRKKSLNTLVANMAAQIGDYKNEIIFIGHGDSLEDAEYVRDKVKEQFGIESFIVDFISPTIGAHSGPGTIALFHLGESRMTGA